MAEQPKIAAAPTVRIKAKANVMSLKVGEVADVPATPMVDALVRSGLVAWVDDPRHRPQVGVGRVEKAVDNVGPNVISSLPPSQEK